MYAYWTAQCSIPGSRRGLFFFGIFQTYSGTHPISCSIGKASYFSGGRAAIRPQLRTESRMNEAVPPLPSYIIMACTDTILPSRWWLLKSYYAKWYRAVWDRTSLNTKPADFSKYLFVYNSTRCRTQKFVAPQICTNDPPRSMQISTAFTPGTFSHNRLTFIFWILSHGREKSFCLIAVAWLHSPAT